MPNTLNKTRKLWFANGDAPVRYAQVPMQLLLDSRLAPRHLQIMTVLILHANRETGVCAISRETIMDFTGYNISTISKATKDLSKFGWLDKSRQWSAANIYRVILPVFDSRILREIKSRRIPDVEWHARQKEVAERQERFRIERREKHAEKMADVGSELIKGDVAEFEDASLRGNRNSPPQVLLDDLNSEKSPALAYSAAVPARKGRPFIYSVKARARVVTALRDYLICGIKDSEVGDADLNFYDFRWGDNPDLMPNRSICDDAVDFDKDFDVAMSGNDEYEVPANFI